jgi:uracil-DNA glycosylase
MTVEAHQANSHKDRGWEKFTDSVISWLNKNRSGIVFMLWGAYAQKKGAYIDKVSIILTSDRLVDGTSQSVN